jgi:cysteine-rich repeat protein
MTTKPMIHFVLPLLLALSACKKEDCAIVGDEDANGLADCVDVEACGAELQCQEDGTCAAPFALADPSNGTAGDSTGAANQMDGSCLGDGAPDVVFSVIPNGNLLEITMTPGAADIDLGVFVILADSCVGDGSVAADEIECDDTGLAGDPENLTASVTAGQEVLVIVSGFQGDVGPFTLDISSRNIACGEGQLDGEEECDDGDTNPGDGCDAACAQEDGFDCDTLVEPTVCVPIVCGDGLVDFLTEACDDGDTTPGDGCAANCTIEDGFECGFDEPSVCVLACGNGAISGVEECDDANNNNGDGCAAACTTEANFSCSGDPSVCANIAAECAAAVTAVAAGTNGDTAAVAASDKFEPLTCSFGADGGENLFSFTANTASVIITVTPVDINGAYDPVVYVYVGNCGDTNELDCEDTTFGGEPEVLVVDGTDGLPANGGAITIVVDSFTETSEGAFTLTVVGQ